MKNPFTHLYPIAVRLANQEQKRIMNHPINYTDDVSWPTSDPHEKLFEEFEKYCFYAGEYHDEGCRFVSYDEGVCNCKVRKNRKALKAFIRKHTVPKSEIDEYTLKEMAWLQKVAEKYREEGRDESTKEARFIEHARFREHFLQDQDSHKSLKNYKKDMIPKSEIEGMIEEWGNKLKENVRTGTGNIEVSQGAMKALQDLLDK